MVDPGETGLSDWVRKDIDAGTECRLRVWYRPGEEHWTRIALNYWRNQQPGLEHVHNSRGAIVERGQIDESPVVYYFKRYAARDWSDRIKSAVRGTRGRRALLAGERLETLGFHAPRAECLMERRAGLFALESVLIARELRGSENCGEWFHFGRGSRVERWRLLRELGREAGRFHAAGIHHGDMRKTNILFTPQSDGDYRFFWLDNERNRFYRSLPEPQRVHNLMQLNMDKQGISRSDRMRFWNAYLETAKVPPETKRRIMGQVIRWTRKRWIKRGWL
ncbi:MAG: lipopolysaccharide kinase InaA family protein [Pseudomonadota bacterium]|nr:lipopolysaccharide kinase InaA family protein [Pseudomonadota bacterium]